MNSSMRWSDKSGRSMINKTPLPDQSGKRRFLQCNIQINSETPAENCHERASGQIQYHMLFGGQGSSDDHKL
ncbi:hypothetical protein DSECCO2_463860 [anaerobic digester metagenome]